MESAQPSFPCASLWWIACRELATHPENVEVDIDQSMSYDTIRGLPDLWIRDDDPIRAEVVEEAVQHQLFWKGDMQLTTDQLDDLRKVRRAILASGESSSMRDGSVDERAPKRRRHV